VAGASHLRFTDFVIGTILGLTPGTLAFSLLGGQLERALREPSATSIAVAAGFAVVAVSLGWAANKLFGRKPGGTHKATARTG
jgi:uncharacterized membrane protein YdjX (TVP38/TMEM64 family)